MVKATLISMMIVVLLFIVYVLDLFAFLSENIVFYVAVFLVVVMLIVAGIILGNPLIKDERDDENYK